MSSFRIALAIVSAIVLFLYGLGAFSEEIQKVGGTLLKGGSKDTLKVGGEAWCSER